MTAPFNWAGLAARIRDMQSYNEAADYIRERIEAAFVPVDQANDHSMCHRPGCSLTSTSYGLASCGCWDTDLRARAEAAEARNKVLEEALRKLAPMVDWMPHPRCVSAEQIIRQALGAQHE